MFILLIDKSKETAIVYWIDSSFAERIGDQKNRSDGFYFNVKPGTTFLELFIGGKLRVVRKAAEVAIKMFMINTYAHSICLQIDIYEFLQMSHSRLLFVKYNIAIEDSRRITTESVAEHCKRKENDV